MNQKKIGIKLILFIWENGEKAINIFTWFTFCGGVHWILSGRKQEVKNDLNFELCLIQRIFFFTIVCLRPYIPDERTYSVCFLRSFSLSLSIFIAVLFVSILCPSKSITSMNCLVISFQRAFTAYFTICMWISSHFLHSNVK